MKTLEEFRLFYENDWRPQLRGVERRRLILAGTFVVSVLAVYLVAAAIAWAVIGHLGCVFIAIPFLMIPFVKGYYERVREKYNSYAKPLVVGRIARFIEPSLRYEPKSGMMEWDYSSSRLFLSLPAPYKSEDLFFGRVGETEIRFSEVDAGVAALEFDEGALRTGFKGLLFVADFGKTFQGETVVLPDRFEKRLGKVAQQIQSRNPFRGELMKLEDPDFEKEFVVYGTNAIETRYILSPSLMERITNLRKRVGKPLRLSFVESKMYMAISYTRLLFEPPLFRSLPNFERLAVFFQDLCVAIGIVEDLNLNTRIWGKR